MDALWLRALDLLFLVFHTLFILFCLLGWAVPSARRLNLIALTLTGLSWIGLGLVFGIGYCPLTDWHWRVLRSLGATDLPRSYTQYLLQRVLGIPIRDVTADVLTGTMFAVVLLISILVNVKKYQDPDKPPHGPERNCRSFESGG